MSTLKEMNYGYAVEMYHVPADMGGGIMSVIPELPGCIGVGYSEEEAMAALSKAVERWHEQLDTKPVQLSGNVQRKLALQAEKAGMSINDFLANLLTSYNELIENQQIAATV